jgi:outer membrane biosynthesis protein TonB
LYQVEPRRFIRSGIAVSAVGHLSVLAMVMILAEVHPFGSVTAEPITVDIVSSEEAPPAPKPEEPPPELKLQTSDAFELPSKSAPAPAPAAEQQAEAKQQPAAKQQAAAKQQPAATPQAAAQPQQQAALSTPPADAQPATPQPPQPSTSASTSASPGFAPPQPDVSVKYGVMLGLPPDLSVQSPKGKGSYDFDSPAAKTADVASGIVTEFRRRLKTCAKLPPSIAPSDNVMIKLRVLMTIEGKLAAEPILIEASASAKGPALMQGAIGALQACQPYAMLPADRYGEWKVLDLSFTPQDFGGAS